MVSIIQGCGRAVTSLAKDFPTVVDISSGFAVAAIFCAGVAAIYQDPILKFSASNSLKFGKCEQALEQTLRIKNITYQESLLKSIAIDSTCLHSIAMDDIGKKMDRFTRDSAPIRNYYMTRDTSLRAIVDNHIKYKSYEEALATALRMYSRDSALGSIAADSTCLERHPSLALKAALRIARSDVRDTTLEKMVDIHIKHSNVEEALNIASHMNHWSVDPALGRIASDPTCIERHPALTLQAALKIDYYLNRDPILRTIVDNHIKHENCEEALSIASKIVDFDHHNQALLSINEDPICQEKLPAGTLKASSKMS